MIKARLKRLKFATFGFLVLLLALCPVSSVFANGLGHGFYGTVKVGGVNAIVGTVISAKVGPTVYGSWTVATPGQYALIVQDTIADGATIDFYVGVQKADQTYPFHDGWTTGLNLTVGPPAEVGNLEILKYEDLNEDGDRDGGEDGLSGWQFAITGPASYTETTNTAGLITLSDIPVGAYTIAETLKADWVNTDPGGTAPYSKTAVVTDGGTATVEFGNYLPPPPELGNLEILKYDDLNEDGDRDVGENGLGGWVFAITGPASYTKTTNTGGLITLSDIPVGAYTITETLKAGWQNTDPGTSPPQKTATVTTEETTTVEFGNYLLPPPEVGNLEILKYEDLNEDGDRDAGEDGLSGWYFAITGPSSYTGTTGADGYISLSGIPVGAYTITETLKSGWQNTDPGTSPPQKTATVTTKKTTTVEFGNYLPSPPPPPPPPEGVGGTAYPPNKLAILAPWLGLALILAIGGGILIMRRRRAN